MNGNGRVRQVRKEMNAVQQDADEAFCNGVNERYACRAKKACDKARAAQNDDAAGEWD